MTQGEKVGRSGDREAIRALDAVIFEKIEGVPWLAKHILAAIREGKVPGVILSAPPCARMCEAQAVKLTMASNANERDVLQKQVAELRGKVGDLEGAKESMRLDALNYCKSENGMRAKLAAAEADRDYWRNSFDGERAAKRTLVKMLESDISELQSKLATAERDEARGLLPKWIPCSERLPECRESCESMWGGTARSDTCLVLYADDPKHWDEPGPHISTGFLLDYSVGEENCFEWMYPIDRTGGLERCSSHGGPVPIAWMPLPEGTSP